MTKTTHGEIEEALQLLTANGYEVTKPVDPGQAYIDGLVDFAKGAPNRRVVTNYGQATLDMLSDGELDDPQDVEIYVEIDRALLYDVIREAGGDPVLVHGGELWTHLWPVVVRHDEDGDVVLHVTSGERAQFGKGED